MLCLPLYWTPVTPLGIEWTTLVSLHYHPTGPPSVAFGLTVVTRYTGAVYRKLYVDFLETSFVVNLGVLAIATYYVKLAVVPVNQAAVVYTSVGVAFATFVGVVLYHTYLQVWPELQKRIIICIMVRDMIFSTTSVMRKKTMNLQHWLLPPQPLLILQLQSHLTQITTVLDVSSLPTLTQLNFANHLSWLIQLIPRTDNVIVITAPCFRIRLLAECVKINNRYVVFRC